MKPETYKALQATTDKRKHPTKIKMWLRKLAGTPAGIQRLTAFAVSENGGIHLGWRAGGAVFGARLPSVMKYGKQTTTQDYTVIPIKSIRFLDNWFDDYLRLGVCVNGIDPEHKRFTGRMVWELPTLTPTPESRRCKYCNAVQRQHTVIIERKEWRSV